MRRVFFLCFAVVLTFAVSAAVPADASAAQPESTTPGEIPFAQWLVELRAEARAKGISSATLDATLTGLEPIARVVELDRRQPEFTWTFRDYMSKMVNDARIEKGRKKLAENAPLLNTVGTKYGIDPRFLVAFWGLETDFGRLAEGYFPTVAALATLAYDGRRSAFFREQLFAALKIIDQGHITPERMKGSWAGAMGHFQFIPTTFAAYAQDYDGDGKRDIWGNPADAYASAANFLTKSGWNNQETWGREVKLPGGFDFNLTGLEVKKPMADWQALGVRRVDGRGLPAVDIQASLVVPSGAAGPAFLVYDNFRTIMVWNRSIYYALAVGHLADRLAKLPALTTLGPQDSRGLTFNEGEELQRRLTDLGFDTGGVDGVVGPQSREAIREFQRRTGRTPDGYPSVELLEAVRKGL